MGPAYGDGLIRTLLAVAQIRKHAYTCARHSKYPLRRRSLERVALSSAEASHRRRLRDGRGLLAPALDKAVEGLRAIQHGATVAARNDVDGEVVGVSDGDTDEPVGERVAEEEVHEQQQEREVPGAEGEAVDNHGAQRVLARPDVDDDED